MLELLALTVALTQQPPPPSPPRAELRIAAETERVTAALEQVLAKDPNGALVTIDSEGRPRVRTVAVHVTRKPLRFWVATRPTTRKLDQIRSNPNTALYFSVDDEESYASVMGQAFVHDDEDTKRRVRWQSDDVIAELYPRFPADYVLIELVPSWIEVGGQGATYDDSSWRPEALLPRLRDREPDQPD